MAMGEKAMIADMWYKLLKVNAKYNRATNKHHCAKVFKEWDRLLLSLLKERFFMGLYSKMQ
jgi:hypothetical protein